MWESSLLLLGGVTLGVRALGDASSAEVCFEAISSFCFGGWDDGEVSRSVRGGAERELAWRVRAGMGAIGDRALLARTRRGMLGT